MSEAKTSTVPGLYFCWVSMFLYQYSSVRFEVVPLVFFYTESLKIMTNKLSPLFSIGQIHYIEQNIDSLYLCLCVCVAMGYTHLPY